MKRISTVLLFYLFSFFIYSSVHAEGSCPPGYYPIGGQGVQGCAPIPGSQTSSVENAPRPSGRWADGWGAVASSASTHDVGFSSGMRSKRSAEQAAIQRCSVDGARDCNIIKTYKNQCFAWAVPVTDGPGMAAGLARAPGLKNVESLALSQCVDPLGERCEIFYSNCSDSIFISK